MSGKDDSTCSVCGRDVAPLPYICTYCGRTFCAEHRLPEIHNCEKLSLVQETYRHPTSEDLLDEIDEFEKARRRKSSGGLFGKLRDKFFSPSA